MGNPIRFTIDGVAVNVERGGTILEAALGAGIRIPHLCHDRRLVPFGACRLCVVEQKGKSEFLPACFTPARQGMEIVTQSPKITESRRLQLQLILLNHPMICPRCEKEGECELQNLVYEYGVEDTLYPWERMTFPTDDSSPLLQRDPNKCILCGRCARICDEVQGVGELSFTRRGIKTAIDTDFHRPINCEFCGQCLDTCPVGAITSDRFDYKTKGWELDEASMPCPYCGCGCLLTVGSKGGEIKRVTSHSDHGPNDGNLCVKGRFGWDVAEHPQRIRSPLLRTNGELKEVGWEEALRFVAQSLGQTKKDYGPHAIAGLASSRLTNEELYLFQKLLRQVIGTDHLDHEDGITYRGLTEGLKETLGTAASTNSIGEIRKADCILVIGVDPARTHPIIKNEIYQAIRRNRARLIVLGSADIGLSQATRLSPLFQPGITLLAKPGSEVACLNALSDTILREGLEDRAFIEERTAGIKDLADGLASRREELRASLEEDQRKAIDAAARAFAQAKQAMILIGSGRWSSMDSERVAVAASNLALITGHLGKPSSGILVLLEKCNAQGAIDLGVYSRGDSNLLQRIEEGKFKALYLVGADPDLFRSGRRRDALTKLDLLVVQDPFMNDLVQMAHVVLPACTFTEKGGSFTNLERRVQKLHPSRSPRHSSMADLDIFLRLTALLTGTDSPLTPEAVFEKISTEIDVYRDVREGEQWPRGSGFLHSREFPNGRARLIPVDGIGPSPRVETHPFLLIQRPSLFQSGLLSARSEALKKVAEKPYLEINPSDAETLGIEEGEVVEISTLEGQSLKLPARRSPTLVKGVVTAPYPCPVLGNRKITSVQIQTRKKGGL